MVLLLMSWTQLSAQTGKSDSTICYTRAELQKIASRMVYAGECDSLLKLDEKQAINLGLIILNKEDEINKLQMISNQKEVIISGKDKELKASALELKKTRRKLNWTKYGWISSSLALVITSLYFAIR